MGQLGDGEYLIIPGDFGSSWVDGFSGVLCRDFRVRFSGPQIWL